MEEFNDNIQGRVPTHVSIIMDGNGRWAQLRGKERVYGHSHGVESVRACVEAAAETGVRYLSLFAFSSENWGRPEAEVNTLMKLMFKAIADEIEALKKQGVRFRVLGDMSRLEPALVEAIRTAEAFTEPEDGKEPILDLIIFLSYSGKWDIRQAARRMAEEGGEDIEEYLVTAGVPDPDLLIRTSGEQRISNYMLWQLAYTEFVFTPTLWPDFRKEQYLDALREYASRDRRFGKVK